MYDWLDRGPVTEMWRARKAVGHHRGGPGDFLRRHEADAARASRDGVKGLPKIAPYLLDRVGDARMMRLAWDDLATRGGLAPGPNGRRYSDLSSAEAWVLCRCLAEAVQKGTYRPGPERVIWVPKASGKGQRPIVLLNVEDRAVQRAAVLVLQPLLDPLFDPRSFGFRPKRSHLHALAAAERLAISRRRTVWLTHDVRDAFTNVPVSRLLQVVGKLLPDDRLVGFLEHALPACQLKGLRQGGSLSPLMLNVYLNQVLDRLWRRDNPKLPLLRVADDLLVLSKTRKQAEHADAELRRLLVPAAMPIKETFDDAVTCLRAGGVTRWLGLDIAKPERGLSMSIGDRAWSGLTTHLALAHAKPDAPLRAARAAVQWLGQRGPCYAWSDRQQACQRILDLARDLAFEELPTAAELERIWQCAHARWCRLRGGMKTSPAVNS
jgi:hypothetical protein